MKRLNDKGFMFTETIVVTTILMVSIMSIYVVFSNLYNNYKARTKYENVEALYAANNVKNMLGQNGINYIDGFFNNTPETEGITKFVKYGYIDFAMCPDYDFDKFGTDVGFTTSYYNLNYCSKLIAYSNIKTALFTNYDITLGYGNGIDDGVIDNTGFSNELKDYINYIRKNREDLSNIEGYYRIIIELNNGNFSNIIVQAIGGEE